MSLRNMSSLIPRLSKSTRVAVLYQAAPPPAIDNVRKPMKPGGQEPSRLLKNIPTANPKTTGYQDSGADIAYNLSKACGINISTPHAQPDPSDQTQWCFPDTETGILAALDGGATHLWANTIVHKTHPLQISTKVVERSEEVKAIGQPPCLVELYDDKRYVNDWLRSTGHFTMPRAWTLARMPSSDAAAQVDSVHLAFPIVAKPCRGRGSAGVKLCKTAAELARHVESLYLDSSVVMLEEFLGGEEATVTVMPPTGSSASDYWAMPIVTRFNHEDGIAPYNGNVAVTSNSQAVSAETFGADSTYAEVARQCEGVARLLKVTAPIRIDVRRRRDESGSPFVLFDINMKPVSRTSVVAGYLYTIDTVSQNMTGPGRPGREEQASLTALAAAQMGWDYPRLLLEMLSAAVPLQRMRELKP